MLKRRRVCITMTADRKQTIENEEICYIDSHVHFWKLKRGDYHWLKPDSKLLYRDFTPSEIFELAATADVQGFIAVQAASTVAETEFLLELAEQHDRVIGVVGWLDLFSESFRDEYGLLRNNPRFVGIRLDRSIFEECTERVPDLLLEHLRLLEEDGFTVDLLIRPDNMQGVIQCLRHVPQLKAVGNHLGIPPYREGVMEPWAEYIDDLSRFPNVYCKWSGMITQAAGLNNQQLASYIHHTSERFGANRIMFGSDWPVALQAGSYKDVVDLFEQLLPDQWGVMERKQVRMANALAFYFGTEEDKA